MAFSIQLKGRNQLTAEEFADLSKGKSQQYKEIKQPQKNQQGASQSETKKLNPEIRRIISKADDASAEGRSQDSLQILLKGRKKYPLSIFLFEREFDERRLQGEDPSSIFYDYIEKLDNKNPAYHLAWYYYHKFNQDDSLAIKSLQRSIDLDADNYYKVAKISKLVHTQYSLERYEDAISSANRFFELRAGREAKPTTDGVTYSIRGRSKRKSGNYSVKEWCSDFQRAHNIGWRMDVNDRNPDPTKCPI